MVKLPYLCCSRTTFTLPEKEQFLRGNVLRKQVNTATAIRSVNQLKVLTSMTNMRFIGYRWKANIKTKDQEQKSWYLMFGTQPSLRHNFEKEQANAFKVICKLWVLVSEKEEEIGFRPLTHREEIQVWLKKCSRVRIFAFSMGAKAIKFNTFEANFGSTWWTLLSFDQPEN